MRTSFPISMHLVLGLALAPGLVAGSLETQDGALVEDRVLRFDGRTFHLATQGSLSRDEVAAVNLEASVAPPAPPPTAAPASARSTEVAAWEALATRLEAAHPGAPVIMVEDEVVEELFPDGTRRQQTRAVYKIQKDAGIGYGSSGVGFDPARERARLVRARTISPDGRVRALDPATLQVVDAPSSSTNLTNRKQMMWQLEGVRVGTYVEHVVESVTFEPFRRDFFFPKAFFQGSVPVGRSRLVVRLPKGQPFVWSGHRLETVGVEHRERLDGEVVEHVWEARDIPPMVPEPRMPGRAEMTPRVSGSTVTEWKPFFDWEADNLRRNIQAGPAVTAKAREVAGGAEDADAKVAAVYRFLQDEIRYVSVKSGIGSGWAGHPAEDTLANGYGDCVDKAVLFAAMLGVLGIEAEPVTIMTNDVRDMETKVPGLDANHCITRVKLPGRTFFLDSTTSNYRYPAFRDDDHGQPATSPLAGEIVTVPFPAPETNLARRTLRLALAPDGTLLGEDAWDGAGPQEARQRRFWKRIKPSDQPKVFQDHYASLAPGAGVLDFTVGNPADLETPLTYSARFRAPRYGIRAGPLMIVRLPFFELAFSEAALPQRKYPIDYRTTSRTMIRWELALPDGFVVKAAPDPVEVPTRAGFFRLRRELRPGLLVLERELVVEKPWVEVADYPAHRTALQRLEALGRERIFLEASP